MSTDRFSDHIFDWQAIDLGSRTEKFLGDMEDAIMPHLADKQPGFSSQQAGSRPSDDLHTRDSQFMGDLEHQILDELLGVGSRCAHCAQILAVPARHLGLGLGFPRSLVVKQAVPTTSEGLETLVCTSSPLIALIS